MGCIPRSVRFMTQKIFQKEYFWAPRYLPISAPFLSNIGFVKAPLKIVTSMLKKRFFWQKQFSTPAPPHTHTHIHNFVATQILSLRGCTLKCITPKHFFAKNLVWEWKPFWVTPSPKIYEVVSYVYLKDFLMSCSFCLDLLATILICHICPCPSGNYLFF